MCKVTYDDGNIVGHELVDFAQIEHLVERELGFCIQISGMVAEAIGAEMNKGRCNYSYLVEFVRQNLTAEWLRDVVIPQCRSLLSRGGEGFGVTGARCSLLPVHGDLAGVGHIVGIYFPLKKYKHACCLLPNPDGTEALFFDPNEGFMTIRQKEGRPMTADDLAEYIKFIYDIHPLDPFLLQMGQYELDPSWTLASHGFRGRYSTGEPVPPAFLPRKYTS